MEAKTEEIEKAHSPGSFLRLFWEHQLQAIKTSDRRQLRWHPMIVKWALHLKLQSSSAYRTLRSTLVLPSEHTLRDYTHFYETKSGFDENVDKQLMKEAQVDVIADFQRYVCLVFDEVRIKENLVYDKHSLQVIGFVNLGDVNNQLLNFEQEQISDGQSVPLPTIAKHMFVFMVRGIFSRLEFPYAQFPCASNSGDVIFPLVWECVKRLEACNLKVITLTASNRKFFRMHKKAVKESDDIVYKTINVYSPEKRPLYFLSLTYHILLKQFVTVGPIPMAIVFPAKRWLVNYTHSEFLIFYIDKWSSYILGTHGASLPPLPRRRKQTNNWFNCTS